VGGYCGMINSAKKKKLLQKEGIKIRKNRIVDFGAVLHKFS
jgi:hypothetical protein